MTQMINFPNLGVHFDNVRRAFSVLGFDITMYGIMVGLGFLIALIAIILCVALSDQHEDNYIDLFILGTITSLVGARIFYVILTWSDYKGHFFEIFNLRKGGMEIFGALIGLIVLVVIFTKIRQIPTGRVFDTITPALILGQIMSLIGHYFAREGFGEYTDGPFAMELPLDAVRISDVTDRMKNHIEVVDSVRMIKMHPIFLYEIVLCIAILIGILVYSKNKEVEGQMFNIYLGAYALGRFFLEGFKEQKHFLPGTKISAIRTLSMLIFLGAVLAFVINRVRFERQKFRRVRQNKNRKYNKNNRNVYS